EVIGNRSSPGSNKAGSRQFFRKASITSRASGALQPEGPCTGGIGNRIIARGMALSDICSATMTIMADVPDVYISYSQFDREFVVRLPTGLKQYGCRVLYAELLDVGEPVAKGLENARYVVTVMSGTYFYGSLSREHEWEAALRREEKEGRVIVLPVMIDTC